MALPLGLGVTVDASCAGVDSHGRMCALNVTCGFADTLRWREPVHASSSSCLEDRTGLACSSFDRALLVRLA